jgi:hypothetical protein
MRELLTQHERAKLEGFEDDHEVGEVRVDVDPHRPEAHRYILSTRLRHPTLRYSIIEGQGLTFDAALGELTVIYLMAME